MPAFNNPSSDLPRGKLVPLGLMVGVVAALWVFPALWYTASDPAEKPYWLVPKNTMPGWRFREIPLDKAMERRLVADALFNGEYKREGEEASILAFSASRYSESVNEIGLFVHTPDRCWTEAGWKIVPNRPEVVDVAIAGRPISFERRVFQAGNRKELVYFAGFVGGQTLPYRLDHNLSVAYRFQRLRSEMATGTGLRLVDTRLWSRVWESFTSRRRLLGPKQFIRVSTSFEGEGPRSDRRIRAFLAAWLEKADYAQELERWKRSRREGE